MFVLFYYSGLVAQVNVLGGSLSVQEMQDRKQASAELKMTSDLYNLMVLGETFVQAGNSINDFSVESTDIFTEGGNVRIEAFGTSDGAGLLATLEGMGLRNGLRIGNAIEGMFPMSRLGEVGAIANLQFMRLSYRPRHNVGLVTSQGDAAMRTDIAKTLGIDGSGVTVGVLSDSYDTNLGAITNAADDIASSDLPAASRINVLQDLLDGSDEGRAMMQLIHDVVPGSDLAFHTAFGGQLSFAQGIRDLRNAANCDVIVDDVINLLEPAFQNGPVAQAANEVVADGAVYLSSAGNQARDAYAGSFTDSGLSGPFGGPTHDFDPGLDVDDQLNFTLPPLQSVTVILQWNNPAFSASSVAGGAAGATTDLDLFLYENGIPAFGSFSANIGGDPVEGFSVFNPVDFPLDLSLVIESFVGLDISDIRIFFFYSGAVFDLVDQYPGVNSGTTYGHANAEKVLSIGAARYDRTPPFGVDPALLESFSSAGGVPLYFNDDGSPKIAALIGEKPWVTGPQGTNTTFFGFDYESDGFPNFFGTSASAPHVAALAALLLEADKGLTPSEISNVLRDHAEDMLTSGFDFDSGHGYVDGLASVLSLCTISKPVLNPQEAVPTLCSESDNPPGTNFTTGIVLSIANQTTVDAAGGDVTYTATNIESPGLIAGVNNASAGVSGGSDLIVGDTWINPTSAPVTVKYTIQATASYEGGTIICDSEPKIYEVLVLPKPSIEVEVDIVGVTYPTSDVCGHFNLILDVEICNDGPVKVENLDVDLDLEKYSNGIFAGHGRIMGVVEDGEVEDDDDLNDDFRGDDDNTALFDESTGSLDPGDCITVRVRVEVAPDQAASVEAASAAEFRARGVAKADTYNGLRCYSDTDYGKDVLGDCWHKSRTAGVNDVINVTVDQECEAIVTPDMLLENHFGDCDTEEYPLGGFYRLRLLTPGELEPGYPKPYLELGGTRFDGEGCFIVYVENVGAFCEPLWGEVCLEDKTAPQFECEPEEIDFVYRTYQVQTARGVLSESQDGQINFSDYSCFKDEYGSPGDCAEPYKALEFYVSETDVYTFELWDPEPRGVENDEEMHLSLYQGEFNPDEPCSNILAQSNIVYEYGIVDNDEAPDARLRVALPLIEGKKYTLIVATEDCGPDPRDEWIVYAFSDGSGDNKGRLLDGPESENEYEDLEDNFGEPSAHKVKKRLYCDDLDYILNSDEYTKNPEAEDNCDHDPETWFKDELHTGGDCAEVYIKRTWYVRDGSGNEGESCEQIIRFRRPDLGDVQKPPTTVPVECDELVAEILDENGHPVPGLSGYPFIITGFGIVDLNESYCNIGADYRDISVIDVCENTQKIVRQWIILDWCEQGDQWELNNGIENNWRQILKVGDFSAPTLEDPGEKIYVSTDGFGCTGDLEIPSVGYEDNCSGEVHVVASFYKGVEVDIVDRYGRPTGDTEISYEKIGDFAPGESAGSMETGYTYKIVYTASDNCGNKSEPVHLLVEAKDDTEPVAVCDDDLHISIGGEGIAKVTAEDVDEGSWDNCELKGLYVSRKLATDDLRDAYLAQVYDLGFDDLVESGLADKDNSSNAVIWVLDEDGDGEWDDENSDNPELFEVLRYKNEMWFTWWREQIKFICDDMDTEVTIELLAVDASYNTNRCWLDVLIEDKIAPYCVAPDDVEIYCTELPYGFDPEDDDQLAELFGEADVTDNCAGALSSQNGRSVDWNCNSGTIVRSFQAEDGKGAISTNSCTQTITVHAVHNYEIKFPKDAEADCGEPSPDTIATTEIACDLLSVNVVDERFEASGDACYKIKRTYKVINWCEYDGLAPAVEISRDADCDGTTGEEDVYVLVRPDEDYDLITYVDRDNDEENNPSDSPCYPDGVVEGHYDNSIVNPYLVSTGYWQYAQYIKVYDTTAPEIEFTGDYQFCSFNNVDCDAPYEMTFNVTDICASPDVVVKAFIDGEAVAVGGSYPNYSVSGREEVGSHELEIHAVDGCQNSELLVVDFYVIDCKAPTPICINGLAIELMPTEAGTDADGDGDEDAGAMTIWASDFKVSGLEDCAEPVSLSINRVGETPNRDSDNLILTCDDPDTLAVEIYAWDSADNPTVVQPDGTTGGPNYDHCVTYVLVQDNMFNLCGGGPGRISVAGLIANEDGEMVENVQVNLSGAMSGDAMTATGGGFSFEGLTLGDDYTITPFKDDDYLNGVSTFDLVLITKHILGSRKLDSPYKMIAADANNSGSISALDLIYMRKLILSVNTNFPNNTSWRFVPASYNFPDRTNPWYESFPEIINYNDLEEAIASGDFVAVKVGDVNGSSIANSLLGEQRSLAGVFRLNVADQEVKAGNEYRVDFTAGDLSIQGYQFTLNHEGLELVDLEYGEAKAENFGIITEDVVTSSWNGEVASGEMFTMVFRAKVDGRLSELLSVNSRYTQSEAYDANNELLDVALNFGDQDGRNLGEDGRNLQDSFHLYQNAPNPFAGQTMISFQLPQAAEAKIIIQDVRGKTLKVIRGEYAKGYNQINVNSSELPALGVLYYTLETDNFTATRKMVVISE